MSQNPAQKHRRNSTPHDSSEDDAWLDAVPVGREFGSPDYERLTALDHAAFAAFQPWERVRAWLVEPNAELDGACPEDAARSPAGFSKVMSILMSSGSRVHEDLMREIEALPVQDRDSNKGGYARDGWDGNDSKNGCSI